MAMAFGQPGQRIGPAERGPLALGIARRLAPGREEIEALFGLAFRARLGSMRVDAIGAAIDLRGADLDQLDKAGFEAGRDGDRNAHPALDELGAAA
jgi:hypothetical protein